MSIIPKDENAMLAMRASAIKPEALAKTLVPPEYDNMALDVPPVAEQAIEAETDWLAVTDIRYLLEFVLEKASQRQLLLFACGCCRRVSWMFGNPKNTAALAVAERFADGAATRRELSAAKRAVREPDEPEQDDRSLAACHMADCAVYRTLHNEPKDAAGYAVSMCQNAVGQAYSQHVHSQEWFEATHRERVSQGLVLRDVVGNPFRPIQADAAWRTARVVELAQVIYEQRRWEFFPVLADALEEAGCNEVAVLDHCRQKLGHVHGCWVLSLLLDKEVKALPFWAENRKRKLRKIIGKDWIPGTPILEVDDGTVTIIPAEELEDAAKSARKKPRKERRKDADATD